MLVHGKPGLLEASVNGLVNGMTKRTIPIALPSIGEDEIRCVEETMQTGWVTQGPRVAKFERDFASRVGAPFACAVSNCTAALYMALKAVGVKPGDAVLTVSHSFIATANAVRFCGAEPVFVDIDAETLNLSPDSLLETLDRDFRESSGSLWYKQVERLAVGESPWTHCARPCGRLAAILVVHQLGMPADLSRIVRIAQKLGVPVVEDAACAIGSEVLWQGQWTSIGQPHGEVACFSFHPRKVITTGDGGMLTTKHEPFDNLFRLLRQHGMGASDLARHAAKQVVFEEYLLTGFNFRLTDIQAALGCAQLERLSEIVDRRRALAAMYRDALTDVPGLKPPIEPAYARSNWQSYAVRLAQPEHQVSLMQALLDRGISTRRGVMCAHREQPYKAGWQSSQLPISERMTDSSVIIPLYPGMSEDDVQYVAKNIRSIMESLSPRVTVPVFNHARVSKPDSSRTGGTSGEGDWYQWPREPFSENPAWSHGDGWWTRHLPERLEELRVDSRWPAFFPSPICLVTTAHGEQVALEKVVGASIVNRFPYTMALSFCARPLSERHYVRRTFMDIVESGGEVAVQFISPGPTLRDIMEKITSGDEQECSSRLAALRLATRTGRTVACPIFDESYLVYEGRLVKPGQDYQGHPIFSKPHYDIGSHRIYFFEITAIQLQSDIAKGERQIAWTALPGWQAQAGAAKPSPFPRIKGYQKGYSPSYRFPSANTVAFEADEEHAGMAVKLLPPQLADQIEVDDDRARWPCFFPSSLGMITSWDADGSPNLMPCGSTTVVSRHPLVVASCISYAAINQRYAPRASLGIIRSTRRFGCGVAFLDDAIAQAIRYAGNVSLASDRQKIANAGLSVRAAAHSPIIQELPIHFDCDVVDEVRLGTHVMFLGEVKRIHVREDVTPDNPLRWRPWAEVAECALAEVA